MVEPISAVAVEAVKTAASATKEVLAESLKEAAETTVKESPTQSMMETIENSSLKTLKAQNEISKESITEAKIKQIEQNRENGALREEKAKQELEDKYPESEGYKIHQQASLRDKEGNILKDSETGESRRVDSMVEKDGIIVKSVEVTSETAPKDLQMAKEQRIRNEGGNYIKDRETGQLIKVPEHIKTGLWRRA